MLMTPYRQTVQALLADLPVTRRPFLRRSLRPDALLATDLPRVTTPPWQAWFLASLERQGWSVLCCGELLELTPPLTPPPSTGPVRPGAGGPALRRLHSLLSRHPQPGGDPTPVLAFLKAQESGPQPLESLCYALCRQCALCLRNHQRLPGELLPYVHHALMEEGEP